VNSGHVLIAEHDAEPRMQIGYCIARDKYSGRDDVGIIYQLNVMPARQKHLVGAMLIQATFQRAAYGCRLFSCWCAQDIQANFFWETLGFVPLAFRTGSRGKQRTHIFWQRRVCANDSTTPWWYPCETRGGAIREDRLVFPIPPDVHWRDAKPIILPGSKLDPGGELKPLVTAVQKRRPRPASSTAQRIAVVRSQSKHLMGLPAGKAAVITGGGIRYLDRADYAPDSSRKASMKPSAPQNDPKLAAAARELRDRWLERVNLDPRALVANGKYEVARCLPATNYPNGAMLPAA
jgi:hypothetical protein